MDKNDLWRTTLERSFKTEKSIQDYLTIGMMLGTQKSLFKQLYLAYLNQLSSFEHKPMLGAKMNVQMDYQQRSVVISRAEQKLTFTFKEFQQFMALIDAVFGEIYPIGTVVELDEALLPKETEQFMTNPDDGLLVVLYARKIPLEDDQQLVDYVGTLWPFGMMPDVEPLFINNLMIKRVVALGLTNDYEAQFTWNGLRMSQIQAQRYSYVFSDLFVETFEKESEV